MDRLHPQSLSELRHLVKLHGAERLIAAIRDIDKQNRALETIRRSYRPDESPSYRSAMIDAGRGRLLR